MKEIIFALTTFGSSIGFAWGAPSLMAAEERSKSYVWETKMEKKKGFQKLVIWSAKTFADSNEAVKMKDAELGILVAKGNLPCKALKIGNGFGADQRIEFTLEVTIEDKKAEVKVSDILGRAIGAYDDGARPSKKEEMDAASKECIDPFVEKIKGALE